MRWPGLDSARGPTFNEFADRFLRDHFGGARSDYYPQVVGVLKAHFGERYLKEITPADIDWFAAKRRREVGNSTLRKNLTALGTMFRLAVRWEQLDANPAADLKKPGEPHHRIEYLTQAEFWQLLETDSDPRLRGMHRLAVAQGLRLKETTGARWEDIQDGSFYVNPDNKTQRPDPVPLTDAARALLDDESDRRRRLEERLGARIQYVFVDDDGHDFNTEPRRNRVSKLTKAAMKRIGRPECSFHTIRHTTASWLVQAGIDIARVRAFMRHKNILTTLRYAHLRPDHLDNVVKTLDSTLRYKLSHIPSAKLLKTNERL